MKVKLRCVYDIVLLSSASKVEVDSFVENGSALEGGPALDAAAVPCEENVSDAVSKNNIECTAPEVSAKPLAAVESE